MHDRGFLFETLVNEALYVYLGWGMVQQEC